MPSKRTRYWGNYNIKDQEQTSFFPISIGYCRLRDAQTDQLCAAQHKSLYRIWLKSTKLIVFGWVVETGLASFWIFVMRKIEHDLFTWCNVCSLHNEKSFEQFPSFQPFRGHLDPFRLFGVSMKMVQLQHVNRYLKRIITIVHRFPNVTTSIVDTIHCVSNVVSFGRVMFVLTMYETPNNTHPEDILSNKKDFHSLESTPQQCGYSVWLISVL